MIECEFESIVFIQYSSHTAEKVPGQLLHLLETGESGHPAHPLRHRSAELQPPELPDRIPEHRASRQRADQPEGQCRGEGAVHDQVLLPRHPRPGHQPGAEHSPGAVSQPEQ